MCLLRCRLFEDASLKLNLKALLGFLSELCLASRQQLSAISKRSSVELLPPNSLLLYRFDDILSNCIASDRPQLHTMRIWNIVAPHLVEVSATILSMYSVPQHCKWYRNNPCRCFAIYTLVCFEGSYWTNV